MKQFVEKYHKCQLCLWPEVNWKGFGSRKNAFGMRDLPSPPLRLPIVCYPILVCYLLLAACLAWLYYYKPPHLSLSIGSDCTDQSGALPSPSPPAMGGVKDLKDLWSWPADLTLSSLKDLSNYSKRDDIYSAAIFAFLVWYLTKNWPWLPSSSSWGAKLGC